MGWSYAYLIITLNWNCRFSMAGIKLQKTEG